MINEKEQEKYKADFGRLTLRSAMLSKLIYEYQKELTDVHEELDRLYKQVTGDIDNGSTVCKKKQV